MEWSFMYRTLKGIPKSASQVADLCIRIVKRSCLESRVCQAETLAY